MFCNDVLRRSYGKCSTDDNGQLFDNEAYINMYCARDSGLNTIGQSEGISDLTMNADYSTEDNMMIRCGNGCPDILLSLTDDEHAVLETLLDQPAQNESELGVKRKKAQKAKKHNKHHWFLDAVIRSSGRSERRHSNIDAVDLTSFFGGGGGGTDAEHDGCSQNKLSRLTPRGSFSDRQRVDVGEASTDVEQSGAYLSVDPYTFLSTAAAAPDCCPLQPRSPRPLRLSSRRRRPETLSGSERPAKKDADGRRTHRHNSGSGATTESLSTAVHCAEQSTVAAAVPLAAAAPPSASVSSETAIRNAANLLKRGHSLPVEYFTVHLDFVGNGSDVHEATDRLVVSATRGRTLWQALCDPLEQCGLAADNVDVFLESSSTPLPLSSDCFRLADSVLHCRVKSDEHRREPKSACLSTLISAGKERKPTGVKGKKSVSSSDDSSYTDISPYGTLTRGSGLSSASAAGSDAFKYRVNTKTHSKLPSLFSPFQANKQTTQDKHEQLNDILTHYSLRGLPKMPDMLTRGRPHYDQAAFHLERHWTDIVANHESLNKRQRDQQEAVWELLSTEVEYLRKLRVVIDVFMCCLFNLQNEQLLNEIEVDKVFSNIGDVFYATCHFWVSHMGQVLRQARKTRELLDPCLLKAGFLVFDKIFEPYTKYCLEQDMCREYIKTKTMENDLFRAFVTWGEKQHQCNRLKLVDLIVKPWQRLTKYKLLLFAVLKPLDKMDPTFDVDEQKRDISVMWGEQHEKCKMLRLQDLLAVPWQRVMRYRLLLKGILKHTEKATTAEGSGVSGGISYSVGVRIKTDMKAMIDNVEKFLHHVNISMRHKHNHKQLSLVIDRIESYDAIDAPSDECDKLVSEFCKLDLTCPVPGCGQQEMRILLQEGNLKLKDKDSKTDVYCFLFTDMLLITKPAARRGDKVKVIKPPMRLDKIIVCGLRDVASFMLLYLNEYHVAQAVYTLHGDSRMWLDGIAKAQTEYKEKRTQYLARADSLLFDLYDETDDEFSIYIDRAASGEVDGGSSLSRCDSSASSATGTPVPTSADTGLLGRRQLPLCPVQISLDPPTAASETATARHKQLLHLHQSKDDTFLRMRRPRSAILRRGSPVDEVPQPRRSSRDDSEIGATSLLAVPSATASATAAGSPWYRTELAANVQEASTRLAANIDLRTDADDSAGVLDEDDDAVFSPTGGHRRVENWFFSRIETPDQSTRTSTTDADLTVGNDDGLVQAVTLQALDVDCQEQDGGRADSRTLTPSSPVGSSSASQDLTAEPAAAAIVTSTAGDVPTVHYRVAASNGARVNNNNNMSSASSTSSSAADVAAALRRRLTSAERRRINEALLRNPSLEVSEV